MPERYDMVYVHKCLLNFTYKKTELDKVILKKNLFETSGLYGIAVFDKKEVFVDSELKEDELYTTILHELFHYFFRDQDDDRVNHPSNPERDRVERRAENSALNMLNWYSTNDKYYQEFLTFVNSLPVRRLSKNDL